MNEKMNVLLKKIKEPKTLFILGITGAVLILISSFFSGGSSDKSGFETENFNSEEYRISLQEDVKRIVRDITGDKKSTVVITLENGIKYSYADDTKNDLSTSGGENSGQSERRESSHITVKTASGDEKALIVTENMPEIRGVAVICLGGDNEDIAGTIRNAVMATLNITSKRVYIAGRN